MSSSPDTSHSFDLALLDDEFMNHSRCARPSGRTMHNLHCSHRHHRSSSSSTTTATTTTILHHRHRHIFPPSQHTISILTCLFLLILFPVTILAQEVNDFANVEIGVRLSSAEHVRRAAERGAILVDRRPSPVAPQASIFQHHRRDEAAATTLTAAAAASTTTTSAAASSTAITVATAASSSSTSSAAVTVPSAFDTSIGSNFTASSCPAFFNSFLSNSSFTDCIPISMYLRNSQSFFDIASSSTKLSLLLDLSCSVNESQCSAVMADLASAIQETSNCGADYALGNPLVTQALDGFLAYEPLYSATCLQSSASGAYCFAQAYTNSSNYGDSYPYYLPVGISLPASIVPSCTTCLKNTMAVFAAFAVEVDQPLSTTYESAAEQINLGCGVNFVNETVAVGTVESGSSALEVEKSIWAVGVALAATIAMSAL